MRKRKPQPPPRCVPTRRDPLFGGWLVRDTATNILLNNSGPWSARGNDPNEFLRKTEAQVCADRWNTLLAKQESLVSK